MGVALIDGVLLVEAKGLRLVITVTQIAGVRVSVEVVVNVDLVRFDEVVVREIHLKVYAVLSADAERVIVFGLDKLDDRLGGVDGLLLATGEGCR
mgnify:CR=1 FL=1